MSEILWVFVGASVGKKLVDVGLAALNRRYYENTKHQAEVCKTMDINADDFAKTLAYSRDKYQFGLIGGWINFFAFLGFLIFGGFGFLESNALRLNTSGNEIFTGLIFFAQLGLLSLVFGLPFGLYSTFVIEQKHGFNRQTLRSFFLDQVKMVALGAVLGGLLLAALLWVMGTGPLWWVGAWATVSGFSILTSWLYPTFLAPLFNKFTPVEAGPLKDAIEALARKVSFQTAGIFLMDASTRSSHGNAYFTGVFGKKRIVLFDTLVRSMKDSEVVAVLAHELGHFKLNHVRWGLLRGIAYTGLLFYLLSLCLPLQAFYTAFHFQGVSPYAALLVFSLWFGLVEFSFAPMMSWISRQNEFAADAFAKANISDVNDMINALRKLREANHAMPLSHPLFSAVYHSHPPLIERIKALS